MAPLLTKDHLIISITAGYTIQTIEEKIGADKRIVRVMPNNPCAVGEGVTAYTLGSSASKKDGEDVRKLFDKVGVTHLVAEEDLHFITGVSECGTAFVYQMIGAMSKAAEEEGINKDLAAKIAA
jgi:pyrroline-5-carboxylate reductase